jgi:hypothetical protein
MSSAPLHHVNATVVATNDIRVGDKIFLHGSEGSGVDQELGLHQEPGALCMAKPSSRDR